MTIVAVIMAMVTSMIVVGITHIITIVGIKKKGKT